MLLNAYINNVESKLENVKRSRESKVEKSIYDLVTNYIEQNNPTTIKNICNELEKRPQQIHQTVKKSKILKKVKVKGFTLVVPSDIE